MAIDKSLQEHKRKLKIVNKACGHNVKVGNCSEPCRNYARWKVEYIDRPKGDIATHSFACDHHLPISCYMEVYTHQQVLVTKIR